jgi:hypothetical protein
MMDKASQKYTTKYIKPISIDYFENDRTEWLDKYVKFDLKADIDIENMINKVGQNCAGTLNPKP